MIKGVDISVYQGNVNFQALKDNVDFVMIRSSYGNGYKDSDFEINRDGARTVGLCIGFYHFAYPRYNHPQAEADWFSSVVSCKPGEILALDFEITYSDPVGWTKAFLDRVASNMGFKPMLYIEYSLAKSYDWSPVVDAGYGLWLALWDYNPDSTGWLTPWKTVAMRQYSDKGSVAGMSPVDMDVFYGTTDQFKAYGNPAPPAPEPVQPSVPAQAEVTSANDVVSVTTVESTPTAPTSGGTTPEPAPNPPMNNVISKLIATIKAWLKGLFTPKK